MITVNATTFTPQYTSKSFRALTTNPETNAFRIKKDS